MPDEAAVAVTAPPATDMAPPGLDDAAILAQLGPQPGATTGAPPPANTQEAKEALPETPKTPQESALLRSLQKRERDMLGRAAHLASLEQSIPTRIEEGIRAGIERALKERFADPRALVKHAGELGHADQAIADALLHKDGPTPEELARKALAEAEALKKHLQDRERQTASRDNESAYMRLYDSMLPKLEHLADEYDRAEILPATYRLIEEYRQECQHSGRPIQPIGDEQWLRLLDRRAKAKQDRYLERQKAKSAPAGDEKTAEQSATKANGKANGSGHQGEKPGASATTTLGKGLAERQSVNAPDPALMTDEEVMARVKALTTR